MTAPFEREYDRAPWMIHAACAEVPVDIFFPARGDILSIREAKRVCAGCPVRLQCLDYALANNEIRGVWGGTTERERRQMRRARRSS